MDSKFDFVKVEDLTTPAFLINKNVLKSNCDRMLKNCEKYGFQLRPHVKTHKCIEVGELQTGGTKMKICTSTLDEAEFFAEAGFDDILYAYPFTPDKLNRCKKLTEELNTFHVMIDSYTAVECLNSNPPRGRKWSVFISVNCGNDREGVRFDDSSSVKLVEMISGDSSMRFAGAYAFCGDTYNSKNHLEVIKKASDAEKRLLSFTKMFERQSGIRCPVYAIGSTPTCSSALSCLSGVTEIHPGNYCFYDVQQMLLGSCQIQDIACKVATKVIGHYAERQQILVDCGFTALTKQGKLETGYGVIEGHYDLKLTAMHQEIGTIESFSGQIDFEKFPIGKMLFILPYHACATANMHSKYYVYENDKIVGRYLPTRGW